MQTILPDAMVWAGITAASLTILDFILPKASKKRISDLMSTLWIWLSYQKTWPYITALRSPENFKWFIYGAAVLLWSFFVLSPLFLMRSGGGILLLMAPIGIGILMAVPVFVLYIFRRRVFGIFVWITNGTKGWLFLLRAFGAYVVLILATIAVLAPVLLGQQFLIGDNAANGAGGFRVVLLAAYAVAFLGVWIVAMANFIAIYAIAFLFTYIVGVYFVMGVLKIVQHITLVLVEHDKGPVLAMAAIATGLGALAKAILGK